jgi:Protein of unknown function (DUF1376)
MVAWFKHDIPAWMDGTESLDDGPYRAYHVICQLIYLNEGPIALNETGIAGRCKQHILAFRRNLRTLIELKKLSLIDGRLSNDRATTELQSVANHRATSAKGGRGSAGVAKGSRRDTSEVQSGSHRDDSGNRLKNNDQSTVPLLDDQHHKTREEETREEKTRLEKKEPPLRVVDDWPENYGDLFWQAYPRKTEKLAAMKKLATIRKSGIVTFADLMAGVRRYAAAVVGTEPQFIKQPPAWLNAGRWSDEAAALVRTTGPPRGSGPQGFESLFQQPERPPDDIAPRSEFDLDLTANPTG